MFVSLIEQRRSIRKFLKRRIEDQKINVLIQAALLSPSSRGSQPWELVLVTDQGLLEELSKAKKHGSAFLRKAPLGIVVCGDPEQSDVWIEDCSIASTLILLAAQSVGLGACWIQIRRRMHDETETAQAYVSRLLGIPEKLQLEAIIAVGYPDESNPPHSKHELSYENVHLNRYGERLGRVLSLEHQG